jgi:hypothetical protein
VWGLEMAVTAVNGRTEYGNSGQGCGWRITDKNINRK